MKSLWVNASRWTLLLQTVAFRVHANCIANSAINAEFEALNGGSIPKEGSCCMLDVCGLTCPEDVARPSNGKNLSMAVSN
jgi:hypothetical protein